MCASCRCLILGCLPGKRPLALAIFIPSQKARPLIAGMSDQTQLTVQGGKGLPG